MPKAKEPQAIDPRGEDVVLFYVGPGVIHNIPARDLHGGDLNRAVYVRAHAAVVWEHEGAAVPSRIAGPDALAALAETLVNSGAYSRNEPADPAEEPEALSDV
jgi:hypothetical protein